MLKRKLKKCINCEKEKIIFSKGRCESCSRSEYNKTRIETNRDLPKQKSWNIDPSVGKKSSTNSRKTAGGGRPICVPNSLPTKHRYKPLKTNKKKSTGELKIFLEIWEERDSWCEWCGTPIIEFNVANYHHIKPKSRFPELRLDKTNIVKICFKCHFNEHNVGKK